MVEEEGEAEGEEWKDEEWVDLSASKLWDFQRSFYSREGVWKKNIVPDFVSSNAFVASQYAKLILAFMRDCNERSSLLSPSSSSSSSSSSSFAPSGSDPEFVLVEIGAGSGRLGFYIVNELLALENKSSTTNNASGTRRRGSFLYVLTDMSKETVASWKTQPKLARFFDSGLMDCAVFDAENDKEVVTEFQELRFSPSARHNKSLFLIGNYILDTLRHDAFRIRQGALEVSKCKCNVREDMDGHPEVAMSWTHIKQPAGLSFYAKRAWELALRWMEHSLTERGDSAFLLPTGAIQLIETVEQWTNQPLLALFGDKGHTSLEEMASLKDPHIAIHGSVSFMVNFCAIRAVVEDLFNAKWFQTSRKLGFKCVAFAMGKNAIYSSDQNKPARESAWSLFRTKAKDPNGSTSNDAAVQTKQQARKRFHPIFPELSLEWFDTVESFDPESFSALQRLIAERVKNGSPSLDLACALLRLSNHDPDIFFKFRKSFVEHASFCSDKQKSDLAQDMRKVKEKHFSHSHQSKDIAFEVGRVLMGLKMYSEAVQEFESSIKEFGDHHVNWYNIGICRFHLSDFQSAFAAFERSLEIYPTYTEALTWKARTAQQKRNGHET